MTCSCYIVYIMVSCNDESMMKKIIRILQFFALTLVMTSNIFAFTSYNKSEKFKFNTQENTPKFILTKFVDIDLSTVLPYILKSGDQLQRAEKVIYKNRNALKLVVFNRNTGRVRYVYIDAVSGRVF